MKCKFYSKNIEGFGRDVCCYDKIKYNNPLLLCTHKGEEENCTCFRPVEYENLTARLMTDKDNPMDTRTLTIQNCDKIILKPKSLEVEVKIETANFDDFDFIEINGHKFKKV